MSEPFVARHFLPTLDIFSDSTTMQNGECVSSHLHCIICARTVAHIFVDARARTQVGRHGANVTRGWSRRGACDEWRLASLLLLPRPSSASSKGVADEISVSFEMDASNSFLLLSFFTVATGAVADKIHPMFSSSKTVSHSPFEASHGRRMQEECPVTDVFAGDDAKRLYGETYQTTCTLRSRLPLTRNSRPTRLCLYLFD